MKIKYATVLLLASALPFLGLTGRTTLTPSQPSGAQGDVVNVEVHFSSDTTEVVGAQFTLTYDPAVMTAGEISTGTAVSNHEVFDEQSSGKISVTLLSMSNAVFTTGTLATISFTLESAVSETTSSVSLVDAETLLVTKAGEKESYEAIQKINDLFLQYAAQGEASKPSTARSITFSATGDGSDASYLWDFGDGTTMTGKDASHVYKTPSSYLITMTATNFLGSKKVKNGSSYNWNSATATYPIRPHRSASLPNHQKYHENFNVEIHHSHLTAGPCRNRLSRRSPGRCEYQSYAKFCRCPNCGSKCSLWR